MFWFYPKDCGAKLFALGGLLGGLLLCNLLHSFLSSLLCYFLLCNLLCCFFLSGHNIHLLLNLCSLFAAYVHDAFENMRTLFFYFSQRNIFLRVIQKFFCIYLLYSFFIKCKEKIKHVNTLAVKNIYSCKKIIHHSSKRKKNFHTIQKMNGENNFISALFM